MLTYRDADSPHDLRRTLSKGLGFFASTSFPPKPFPAFTNRPAFPRLGGVWGGGGWGGWGGCISSPKPASGPGILNGCSLLQRSRQSPSVSGFQPRLGGPSFVLAPMCRLGVMWPEIALLAIDFDSSVRFYPFPSAFCLKLFPSTSRIRSSVHHDEGRRQFPRIGTGTLAPAGPSLNFFVFRLLFSTFCLTRVTSLVPELLHIWYPSIWFYDRRPVPPQLRINGRSEHMAASSFSCKRDKSIAVVAVTQLDPMKGWGFHPFCSPFH